MSLTGFTHESRNDANGMNYVWSSISKIYQWSNQTSINWFIHFFLAIILRKLLVCSHRGCDGLQSSMLNFLRRSSAYVSWKIKMLPGLCFTCMPRKYFISPRSVISNSAIMAFLNSTIIFWLVPVYRRSSTHRHKIRISKPWGLTYRDGSLELLAKPLWIR